MKAACQGLVGPALCAAWRTSGAVLRSQLLTDGAGMCGSAGGHFLCLLHPWLPTRERLLSTVWLLLKDHFAWSKSMAVVSVNFLDFKVTSRAER